LRQLNYRRIPNKNAEKCTKI
jgi:hypothetical protein